MDEGFIISMAKKYASTSPSPSKVVTVDKAKLTEYFKNWTGVELQSLLEFMDKFKEFKTGTYYVGEKDTNNSWKVNISDRKMQFWRHEKGKYVLVDEKGSSIGTDNFYLFDASGSYSFISPLDQQRKSLIKPSVDLKGAAAGNTEGRFSILHNGTLRSYYPIGDMIQVVTGNITEDAGKAGAQYVTSSSTIFSSPQAMVSRTGVINVVDCPANTGVRVSFYDKETQVLIGQSCTKSDFIANDCQLLKFGPNTISLNEALPIYANKPIIRTIEFSNPAKVYGAVASLVNNPVNTFHIRGVWNVQVLQEENIATKEWIIKNMGIDMDDNNIAIDYKVKNYDALLQIPKAELKVGKVAEVAETQNGQWWNIMNKTRLKGLYAYTGAEWLRPDMTQVPMFDPVRNLDDSFTTEKRSWSPKVLMDYITSHYDYILMDKQNKVDTNLKNTISYGIVDVLNDHQAKITAHSTNKSNPHAVTSKQIGLDKCDNTADATKCVFKALNADQMVIDYSLMEDLAPEWYIELAPLCTIQEVKDTKQLGIPSKEPVCVVETTVLSTKTISGYVMQTAKCSDVTCTRSSTSNTTWTDWEILFSAVGIGDYVVESYSEAANWYGLYKSGWIEQGGYYYMTGLEEKEINFIKEMRDVWYFPNIMVYSVNGGNGVDTAYMQNIKTTGVTLVSDYTTGSYKVGVYWEVKGMSKVPEKSGVI